MNKNDFSHGVSSIFRKTIIVLSGLILSLVLLEAGLRLGGFIFSSVQGAGNLRSAKQKGTYRILCLGESTTQGQYPHLLEQVLNQRNVGVRFSVIDKGRGAINTSVILGEIEAYLTEYHPDMVVAMMGINDSGVKYYEDIRGSDTWLFKHCRAYRFGSLLCMHFLKKIERKGAYETDKTNWERSPKPDERGTLIEKSGRSSKASVGVMAGSDSRNNERGHGPRSALPNSSGFFDTKNSLKKAIELDSKNDKAYRELGRLYISRGEFSEADTFFKKALELDPKNDAAYVGLGRLYLEQGKLSQAKDLFAKALRLNPKSDPAYVEFGHLFRIQNEFQKAEDSFKKAIEINPRNDYAYVQLGWFHISYGTSAQAEDSFRKALEINPENDDACYLWGTYYFERGNWPQAEDLLKKAIEFNPKNNKPYLQLGMMYRMQGKLLQAVDITKKDVTKRALLATSTLYEELGRPELAKEYKEKAHQRDLEDNAAVTFSNYRKLKEILDKKGMKLVCVQYPMRNVNPLKRFFEKDQGVIFVDNERVFKEALRKGSYKEYFRDMFAGDFGHCTVKGNTLLAQNIADVILREVFNK
jgi:tetratricopeptide (TPR) repeat protein